MVHLGCPANDCIKTDSQCVVKHQSRKLNLDIGSKLRETNLMEVATYMDPSFL